MRRIVCNRVIHAIVSVLVISALAGCGVHKPFQFYDENAHVKKGSLAVISGEASDETVMLTQYLTQALKQKSTLRVLTQEETRQRIGKYPVTIKRMTPENEDKPVWYAKGEKGRIDAMHEQLKTDYLFVVWVSDLSRWTTTSQSGTKVTYAASVLANLMEYPKAKPMGFSICGFSKDQSCFLFGKSEGDDVNELLKYSADEIADKFTAVTKTEKPGK